MQSNVPIVPESMPRPWSAGVLQGRSKPFGDCHEDLVRRLDRRMDELVGAVESEEFFGVLVDPETPMDFIKMIMREIYLEIYSYQPQVIEATMCCIARMPKMDPRTIKTMMIHQCDESDHGEMALRDYVALGGDEARARAARISPASFNVASLWWGIAHMETPVAYLGALYPFEGLTPRVCRPIVDVLMNRGFPREAMEYIDFHATEDIKHANLVRYLIKDVSSRYPGATEAIEAGLDYFLAIYPMPVWRTAYERAKAEWQKISAREGACEGAAA